MMQLTETVKHLILINILFFIGAQFVAESHALLPMYYFENPLFQFWQPLTSMFMHGGIGHILFNMFGLYMFGSTLEQYWGAKKFLFFYISCGLGAALVHQGVNYYQIHSLLNQLSDLNLSSSDIHIILNTDMIDGNKYNSRLLLQNAKEVFDKVNISQEQLYILFKAAVENQTAVLGASGAIYGVLVAFAFMFPNVKLMLLFLPVPIAAKYFVPAILLIDLISGLNGNSVFGMSTGIAHFAHLGGALTGFLIMWYWKKNQFNNTRWN